MNWFRLKSCIKCQGDLAADNGDWLCLQCGTYYYTGLYQLHPQLDDEPQSLNPSMSLQTEKKHFAAVTVPQSAAPISPSPTSIAAASMADAAAL